jgi:polar amino acid transport system permease protein
MSDKAQQIGQQGSADLSERSDLITAVPLRHPWRMLSAVLLVGMVVGFVIDASHRKAYGWATYRQYIFDAGVAKSSLVTLQLTVYSMLIAVLLGILLAVMRQSPNPVFRAVAWVHIWVFRGTPVYVQLVFWGLLTTLYPTVMLGVPNVVDIFELPSLTDIPLFWFAVIGLGLNESAYMAEIVRAGLLSVDRGQEEAAKALGMSWSLSMRRIIIPQAMRIIIPPTGNEVISMLKTTSLVIAVPVATELYMRTRELASITFNPIPLLLVASTWYLVYTSLLMVLQHRLEQRFARGHGQAKTDVQSHALSENSGML